MIKRIAKACRLTIGTEKDKYWELWRPRNGLLLPREPVTTTTSATTTAEAVEEAEEEEQNVRRLCL